MKFCLVVLPLLAGALAISEDATPMARTVQLIKNLEKEITKDGKNEQASFDTYACWCEKTMERKAKDMSDAKELIAETESLIKKLKAEIASHGAEIAQLNKDIAQNVEAVKDATAVRNKDNKEYANERTESEQCIGAMEAAIKVLTGAGTKAAAFLDTPMQEAKLLSVVAGVRRALSHKNALSDSDIETMNRFVAKPDDFMHQSGMSAAQIGQNPFGDYAPQSSQIQGILKGMYDAFTADLEKDNAEEADSQKSFEELMATKKMERETLDATLQKQETDSASKTKTLSESEVLLDDTSDQLASDEAFFEDTKEACQAKATEWSVRTRLRTEELQGMQQAITILSSKDAKKTFKASVETFVQVSAVHMNAESTQLRSKAYDKLKVLATELKSRNVAKLAVEVKNGGHFDKVIAMIDEMMVVLREEEASDIAHRDKCENAENANGNEMDDLKSSIKKTEASLKRMGNTMKELRGEITALEAEIKATKKDMKDLLKFRNKEVKEFRQALNDDADAVDLLKKAIVALSEFYKRNKMDVPQLIQKPEYAQDEDKAPDATFTSSDSRKSETGGILAILEMIVEDTEKQMKEGRDDDADAQDKYAKQEAALQDTLDAQEASKVSTETEAADLKEKMGQYKKFKNEKNADKKAEGDLSKSLATDCAWVKSHFQKRRDARKDEMDGLVDAKAFLAGALA